MVREALLAVGRAAASRRDTHRVRSLAITLHQLESFLAVAREGSVSAAAERLFVTQPSISAALAALSRELGTDLIEREGRGVALTSAGEAFRPYAADVLGLLEQGRLAAREAAESTQRALRLAAVATAAEYVVPPLLRAFTVLHPEVSVRLEVANRASVIELVRTHAADVAIGGRPPDDERIVGEPFLRNEVVLIAAPDDPFVHARSVAPARLAERTWLVREEGSGTRQLVLGFLEQHGLHPETLTLGSNGSIKQAVQLGLGVSLQSAAAVEDELAGGRLGRVAVRGGLPERHWYALRSATVPTRRSVEEFLGFIHKEKLMNSR